MLFYLHFDCMCSNKKTKMLSVAKISSRKPQKIANPQNLTPAKI